MAIVAEWSLVEGWLRQVNLAFGENHLPYSSEAGGTPAPQQGRLITMFFLLRPFAGNAQRGAGGRTRGFPRNRGVLRAGGSLRITMLPSQWKLTFMAEGTHFQMPWTW